MTTSSGASPFDAVVTHEASLWRAVDTLVESLGTDRLAELDIRAGEHLAAIITTCFLGFPPSDLDTSGGVDLDFTDNWTGPEKLALWVSDQPGVFEVKSLPGKFRKVENTMNRVISRGGDPRGMGVNVRVRRAADILAAASPTIDRIERQLARKIESDDASGHGFLIVHPFDHLPLEAVTKSILGPSLPRIPDRDHIDSLWVFWAPTFITLWSKGTQTWLNLILASGEDGLTPTYDENLDTMQNAENYFLAQVGVTDPSPFIFSFSSERDDSG